MLLSALTPAIYYTSDVSGLTGVVDLAGVKVIQEGHHQTLTQVDFHQGHGHILPALHRGYLLQHGQSSAVLHLVRWYLRFCVLIYGFNEWLDEAAADLCRGDDRLHQKVDEGLIVHRWQDAILHQTHLQTQRSQFAAGSREYTTDWKKKIECMKKTLSSLLR